MGFIKSQSEILSFLKMDQRFQNTELYFCFWQTDANLIKNLVPKPLNPDKNNLIFVYFSDYHQCEAFGPYKECAIFVGVEYKESYGLFCLSMPLDNDMAMAAGRELLGFPKKYASISINNVDDKKIATASCERKGIKFISVKFDFHEKMSDKALEIQNRYIINDKIIFYNFRNFVTKDGINHFHLIKIRAKSHVFAYKSGNAEVFLTPSQTDQNTHQNTHHFHF